MGGWIEEKRTELRAAGNSVPMEFSEKKVEEKILAGIGKKKADGKIKFSHKATGATVGNLEDALSSEADARAAFASSLWEGRLPHFAAANWKDGLLVRTNARKSGIEISIDATGGGAFYVMLLVGKNADAHAFVRISGAAESMGTIEAVLEENAHADISVLATHKEGSTHFLQTCANLQKDAHLKWFVSSFGGSGSVHAKSRLLQSGANCENFGAFFPKGKEKMVVRAGTHHVGTATLGNILTKSALADDAVLDYRGGVRMDKMAVKSESDMNSKNIMLSDRCHVDAIPYLEIKTNDVKASHGTSVGQLDEEEIFYLKSRGIGEKQAQKLVAMGFFAKLLEKCEGNAKGEIEKEIKRCLDGI